MSDRPTGAELIDKLAAQGSASQIADYLELAGVVGQPRRIQHCAIAEYLARETGQAVNVGSGGASLYDWKGSSEASEFVQWDHPQITEFIHRFDDHEYPKLVR